MKGEPDDGPWLPPGEAGRIREELRREGFDADPLVGDRIDAPHIGLNVTVAWPLPAALGSAYARLERELHALGPDVYVYPHAHTHVTVLTAVSFKQYPSPTSETVRRVEEAAAELASAVAELAPRLSPFELECGPPLLARAAAFLPMRNASGEIAELRARALAFCRAHGGILSGASAPRAIHSTVMRFRARPTDPDAFAKAFDAVTGPSALGRATIDRVLVTLETRPYMRDGRVFRPIPLGSARG